MNWSIPAPPKPTPLEFVRAAMHDNLDKNGHYESLDAEGRDAHVDVCINKLTMVELLDFLEGFA